MLYAIAVVVTFHVGLWLIILVLAALEPPHPSAARRPTVVSAGSPRSTGPRGQAGQTAADRPPSRLDLRHAA